MDEQVEACLSPSKLVWGDRGGVEMERVKKFKNQDESKNEWHSGF